MFKNIFIFIFGVLVTVERGRTAITPLDAIDDAEAALNQLREARTRSARAERAAGAASRELRITCVAFGIRNHPCGWIAERHGAYRPALPACGAFEEPENYHIVPLPFTVLPWSRNPSSSSEIEITVPYREGEPESPPSNYREATPFSGKGQPDQLSFVRVVESHIVLRVIRRHIVRRGDRSQGTSFVRMVIARPHTDSLRSSDHASFHWVPFRKDKRISSRSRRKSKGRNRGHTTLPLKSPQLYCGNICASNFQLLNV
ncbi:hypothetical protein GEV33_005838 [Tenebrio molitor]|uniref:Uncharacterized protein n=1 Tax=Tenebrio molitor TaxID=7067 RepID=A0A8J6LEZ6_TENMO|nr:hypothetical protein GEV33_005838 [Tenebrio molitor]